MRRLRVAGSIHCLVQSPRWSRSHSRQRSHDVQRSRAWPRCLTPHTVDDLAVSLQGQESLTATRSIMPVALPRTLGARASNHTGPDSGALVQRVDGGFPHRTEQPLCQRYVQLTSQWAARFKAGRYVACWSHRTAARLGRCLPPTVSRATSQACF